jgi:hypothetical protein
MQTQPNPTQPEKETTNMNTTDTTTKIMRQVGGTYCVTIGPKYIGHFWQDETLPNGVQWTGNNGARFVEFRSTLDDAIAAFVAGEARPYL